MINTMVIKVTNQCNWDCSYCDNVDSQNVELDKLIECINSLQSLNPYITISLSGGEPGMLSEKYLEQVFKHINNPCEIATNGTFFEKDYHNLFKSKLKEFWYHVTPEINDDNTIYDNIETDLPIQYIFVIHNRNINQVIPFIQRNSHIQFSPRFYIGADQNYVLTQSRIATLYYEGICDMNIIDDYKERIKYFSNIDNYNNIIKAQEYCNTISYMPRLDLIKEKIFRCCAGLSNTIDNITFNKINLRLLIKNDLFTHKNKTNIICSSCYNGAWNCRSKI